MAIFLECKILRQLDDTDAERICFLVGGIISEEQEPPLKKGMKNSTWWLTI